MMQAGPSRLLLVDHLLVDEVGHHLGYNLAIADGSRRAGIPAEIVAAHGFPRRLAGQAIVHPVFRRDLRAEPPPFIAGNFRLLALLDWWSEIRFARDIKRIPEVRSGDAIFTQMLAPRHLRQWLKWHAQVDTGAVLFLHLGYRPERFHGDVFRALLGTLSVRQRRRLVFVTDSEKLTAPFSERFGCDVRHLPHILSYPLPQSAARMRRTRVTVFMPGNARREKGIAEVVEAVRLLRDKGAAGDFQFVIQCHHPDAHSAEVLRMRPEAGVDLEWIERPLGEEEYVERLQMADVVLLPYHTDLYGRRTSGIFCECRAAGVPVVTSRGTWAGDRIEREGGGWLVDERDAAGLAATLKRIAGELDSVAEVARSLSEASRAEFHRDAFLRSLVGLFQETGGGNV